MAQPKIDVSQHVDPPMVNSYVHYLSIFIIFLIIITFTNKNTSATKLAIF